VNFFARAGGPSFHKTAIARTVDIELNPNNHIFDYGCYINCLYIDIYESCG
jgi:hypothetical protein